MMTSRVAWVVGLALGTLGLAFGVAHVVRVEPHAAPQAPDDGRHPAVASPGSCAPGSRAPDGDDKVDPHGSDLADGRAILGHAWFDKWPASAREESTFALFLPGGIILYDEGTAYRSTVEFLEFERRGKTIEYKFLQDGRKGELTFTVERCDERPPFDLCLTLSAAPKGPKKLYGFASSQDEAAMLTGKVGHRVQRARQLTP
jgi:hypothetical protein